MRRNPTVLIALVAIGLTWIFLGSAQASTFVMMDNDQLLETSDVVVVGTVTAIESGEGSAGGIQTYVHVQPSRVIKGDVGTEPFIIREPGGTFGERREWIYGAPEFWVGERDLLFLSRNADGTLQTNGLSMGKFTLSVDSSGHSTALRDFGYGASVFDPSSGQIQDTQPETQAFVPLLSRLRTLAQAQGGEARRAALVLHPQELDTTPTEVHESFTFLGTPSRWFEPDSGLAVPYYIDSTGDSKLGFDSSRAAIDAALAAWTNVPTSSLILSDGGTTSPGPFGQCNINRIVFNDPNNEITNPSGCSGVLAMGGYCTTGQTTVVNGTTFYRIVIGKVTFNDGWNNCSGWNQCNVAEVATHEIGHTIGLGHSADGAATMRASAHFDGRCAGLATDDVNAVNFIYPGNGVPPPTNTPGSPPPTNTPGSPPPTNTPGGPPPTNTPGGPPPTNTPPPPPTNTPPPTSTFTPTPTFTRPPIHDSVIAPIKPLNVTIANGRTSATAKVSVKVTNADILPSAETPGHTTKLVASDGSCPAGTIVGLPDFDFIDPGDQDTVQLAGGKARSATVTLNIDSAAFAGLHQQTPMRCTLLFGTVITQPVGSLDPTSGNSGALLELNVVDRNTSATVTQPVLKSVAPVKIQIPRGRTSVTKKVTLRLGTDANGKSLNQTGTLAVSDTSCPTNVVTASSPIPGAAGSSASKVTVVLTINSSAFATAHNKCPARCNATLAASGAGVDPQNANSISRLVIDVIDKNDF